MIRISLAIAFIAISISHLGCSQKPRIFEFGFSDRSAADIKSVMIRFGEEQWPMGDAGQNGWASIAGARNSVPDAADLSWKDQAGAEHQKHVLINPPTPPGPSDPLPIIAFIIHTDQTVEVLYHRP
jgi:hypothetical protein